VGTSMVVVASGGAATRAGALPTDPLAIQSGKTLTVAPVRVDGSGTGCSDDDGVLNEICSEANTGDVGVVIGVPKPKSMVTLEKGLAGTRAAVAITRAMEGVRAGGAAEVGKRLAQSTEQGPTRVIGWSRRGRSQRGRCGEILCSYKTQIRLAHIQYVSSADTSWILHQNISMEYP
jgi:hypothetical protein